MVHGLKRVGPNWSDFIWVLNFIAQPSKNLGKSRLAHWAQPILLALDFSHLTLKMSFNRITHFFIEHGPSGEVVALLSPYH